MTDYGWVCLTCGKHIFPDSGPHCSCGASNFLHASQNGNPAVSLVKKLRDAFERKRYGVDITQASATEYDPDFDLFDVAANEIERLQAIAGSVTPGPSARQIIRERIARLVGE